MGKHTKEGYSVDALAALMKGQYDELTGRSAANNWRPSKVPSLVMPKNTIPTSVPKSVPTQKKKNGRPKDRGYGTLYEFENYKTQTMMEETQKNLQLANDLMEAASKISQVANPVDKGFPNSINDAFKAPEKKEAQEKKETPEKKELPSLFEKAQSRKPKTNNPYEVFTKSEQKKTTKEDIDKALVGRVGKDQLNFSDIKRQDNEELKKKREMDELAKALSTTLDLHRDLADNPMFNPNAKEKPFTIDDATKAKAEFDQEAQRRAMETASRSRNPYEMSSEPTPVDPEDRPWYSVRKALHIPYEVSDRDTTYDKDFDEYHASKRSGKIRQIIKNKYHWSDDEFDKRFDAYEYDRSENEALENAALEGAKAEDHPVLSSIDTVAMTPFTSLEGIVNSIYGVTGYPDDVSPTAAVQMNLAKQSARNAVSDDLGSAGKFVYNAGMNFADQALMTALGGKVGLGLMSGDIAGQGANEALQRGIDPRKAALTGAAQGLVSLPLNLIGFDVALGQGVKAGGNAVVKSLIQPTTGAIRGIGQAALSEGLEEIVEEGANKLTDVLINQDKSALLSDYSNYKAQGMSENDAWLQVAKDVGIDLAQAGLSGAAFGAVIRGYHEGASRIVPEVDAIVAEKLAERQFGKNEEIRRRVKGELPVEPEVPYVVENAQRQAEQARAEIERLNQQIPETPQAEVPNMSAEAEDAMRRNVGKNRPYVYGNAEPRPVSESTLAEINAENNAPVGESAPVEVKAEDIKLSRNKETGEYSYEGYRVVKNGKSGYDVLDADGNSIGKARTLNDAKSTIANAQNNVALDNTGIDTNPEITEEVDETSPVTQEPESAQPVNEVPTVVNPTEPLTTQEVPNVGSDVGNAPPTDVGNPENGGNSPHTKTSEAYTNTGKRGGGWNETEYNQYTDESQFQYEDQTERESVTKAIDMINEEGFEGFKDRVMGKERMSASEIDGLMMEWRILCKQARDIEAAGEDATDAWRESVKVFRKVQEQASNNAQALQAMAKWSRNTPEGMLAQAENILNGRTKVEKSAAQKVLDKFQKEHKGFKFSDDFVAKFLTEAEKLKDLDPKSREYKRAMAELGRMVNSQLPAKFSEKLTSFLMDNMLGNFRTLITRNAGGNIGLNAVEQLLERPLAALIDRGLAKRTGRRTQAGLTKAGILEYLQGFGKGLKEEADDFKRNLYTSRSGEVTFEDAIAKNRHVFKEGGLLDRFYDKMVKHGLSIGDRPFYEAVYNQTLGDYQRLRESGQMGEVIQGLSDEEFNMYAEAAAKMNALAAVYQQDTTLANALLGFKNSIGDLSRGLIGVDILSQFSMPFVKTPANVIERAIDYSPLGLVRNAFRTGREIRNDNFDQNRFANETARNILGTALMGGGAAFANAGGMEGAYSKDTDEKKAQKDAGMIEYGLNLPNGYQTDIGWVPVVGSNLVASAAAMDAFNKGEGNAASNLATGLLAGGKAQLDQSMFQGMQRLFGGSGSYDSDKNLFSNMTDVFSSGLGQFVPSLLRQTGQVSDEYQRDLSNSNPDASLLFMDNYDVNSLANTLPILRNNVLAPKVGTNGELLEENQGRNVGMKILEDMILPGKISKVEYSALNEEANRLKESTTSADAYMPSANRTLVDTDEHKLTNQEWVDYEQKYYKEMTDIGTQVMKTAFYKNADDMEKTQMLKQAYEGIKYGVNHEYNGKKVDGASKAYVEAGGGEKGVKAVLDYVEKGADIKRLENQYGVNINRSDYDKQQKEYPGGAAGHARDAAAGKQYNMSADEYRKAEDEYNGGAAQKAKDVESAKNYGFVDSDGKTSLDAYNKAVELVGNDEKSLKAYSDYKKLGYTKQAQIIPYLLKSNDFDSEQKGRILGGNNVDSLPKGQRGAYDLDNRWTDVYYYNLIRYLADQSGNKNGDTSKKEMQSYISGNDAYVQMLSDDMLNYLKGYK